MGAQFNQRTLVRNMVLAGLDAKKIAEILDLDVEELEARYKRELRHTEHLMNAAMLAKLQQKALAEGDTRCLIYYLEKKKVLDGESSSSDAGLVLETYGGADQEGYENYEPEDEDKLAIGFEDEDV